MNVHVRFAVITAVDMKSSTFWDKQPCSLLKVKRFGGKCGLHLKA
jgi:hypothetical protein